MSFLPILVPDLDLHNYLLFNLETTVSRVLRVVSQDSARLFSSLRQAGWQASWLAAGICARAFSMAVIIPFSFASHIRHGEKAIGLEKGFLELD